VRGHDEARRARRRRRRTRRPPERAVRRIRREHRAKDVAHRLVVNEKSGRAAIAELGLTTSTDENRLITAVRLVRPDDRQTMAEKTFEESAWKPAERSAWRRVWDEEVAGTLSIVFAKARGDLRHEVPEVPG
jgi:hypothetical protein